ncbi:hypothetical protein J1N35_025051, partial [Gossypium stocksii]
TYHHYLLPYPSHIFQALHSQKPRIVRETEQLEKPVLELKFSHKWLKRNIL